MKADLNKIKQLRDATGVSVGDCRVALEKTGGDMDKALKFLQERGAEIAEKKASRAIGAGVVDSYIHHTFTSGATVVVGTETDFVARNPEFREFVHNVAQQVAATGTVSVENLLNEPWIKDDSKTIGNLVNDQIAKFGENIKIQKVEKFEVGQTKGGDK